MQLLYYTPEEDDDRGVVRTVRMCRCTTIKSRFARPLEHINPNERVVNAPRHNTYVYNERGEINDNGPVRNNVSLVPPLRPNIPLSSGAISRDSED